MPKRKVLLVDDEVPVLLTMKAVLEISGFDVDTATSAREGRSKIRSREYQMIITDMRMESDAAGREVIQAARTAAYHPAVALLTAFPVDDSEWQDMGADRMLVKPMQTPRLIQQLEQLLEAHAAKLQKISMAAAPAEAKEKEPGKAIKEPASEGATSPATSPAAKPAAGLAGKRPLTKSARKPPAARQAPATRKAVPRTARKPKG